MSGSVLFPVVWMHVACKAVQEIYKPLLALTTAAPAPRPAPFHYVGPEPEDELH